MGERVYDNDDANDFVEDDFFESCDSMSIPSSNSDAEDRPTVEVADDRKGRR